MAEVCGETLGGIEIEFLLMGKLFIVFFKVSLKKSKPIFAFGFGESFESLSLFDSACFRLNIKNLFSN